MASISEIDETFRTCYMESMESIEEIVAMTDVTQIFKSTIKQDELSVGEKLPWDNVEVGFSFSVPLADMLESTLRTYASRVGKRTGKKFRVVIHRQHNCYEVARVK